MKSYDELKDEMKAIQQQMIESKKSECASALNEMKRFFKKFGSAAEISKVALAIGRKLKNV
jgi:hypothetical protein